MGFNYAREKARFDRLWDKLRKEYKVAGMEDDAIQKLYDFDWQWFCSQRTYTNHNQQLPETVIREDRDEENSRLFQKFTSLFSLPEAEMWHSRYGWVDSLSDIRLVVTLKLLSAKDIELLTLLVIEGFNQSEIAQKWGCSQRAISKQFQKIKNFSDKVLKKSSRCLHSERAFYWPSRDPRKIPLTGGHIRQQNNISG